MEAYCELCGLPPCTCRCGLVEVHLAPWHGVLRHLVAAQLQAVELAKVVAAAEAATAQRLATKRAAASGQFRHKALKQNLEILRAKQ